MWHKTSEVLVGHAEVLMGDPCLSWKYQDSTILDGRPSITYAIYEWCDCEGLPQRSSSGNVVNDGVNHGVHQLSRRKPHRMTTWGDYQWTMCISSWLCRFATLDLQDFWVRAEGRECDTPQERSQVRRVSFEAGDPEDLLWASFEVMVPRLNFSLHLFPAGVQDIHPTRQ